MFHGDSTILGNQRPALSSIPVFTNTAGPEAIDLAQLAGLELDDWQQWVLTNSLGEQDDGIWAAFEVCLIIARQNGKTGLLEARELAGLFLFGEQLIIHTAHEYRTAEESYRRLRGMIENTPELHKRVKPNGYHDAAGEQGIELRSGARIRYIARSRSSGRGFSGDLLVWDEDMILDAGMVASTMPTLSARPNPQVWYCGSAGLGRKSSQLAGVRRRGMNGTSPHLFYAEWSINAHNEYCEPDCARHDDPDAWTTIAKANPAFNIRITPAYVQNEREAMESAPDEWARERLTVGTYPLEGDAWLVVPKEWWDATQDNSEEPPQLRNAVFAIDINPERTMSAIGVAGARPDGKVGVELVDGGFKPGVKWIIPRIKEINERWGKRTWVIDPRAAAGSFLDDLDKAGIKVEKMQVRDVCYACGQFFDGCRDDWLVHLEQKPLRQAIAGADKRPLSESWAWDRKNSATEICPLVACTYALWGYLRFGADSEYELGETVHFDGNEIIRLTKLGVYASWDLQRLHDEGLIDSETVKRLADMGITVR